MSYKPNFGNCSINVNRVSYLVANVTIEIVNSPMTTKTIIVEAIKRKTCVEHKPQIKIKHITNVIIDDANKHNDIYLNIQRSLKKEKMLLLFFVAKKNELHLRCIQHQQDCTQDFYIDCQKSSIKLSLIPLNQEYKE